MAKYFKKITKHKSKIVLLLVLSAAFLFGFIVTTFDAKERAMSDTYRYLYFDTPEQNIKYYQSIASAPLPENRSSLDNRYNLCYLAYKNFNPDLTMCAASPLIIKSLATGFTYYNILPALDIPQTFFNQHISFIVLFYLISFAMFLFSFYFIYKYISPFTAVIFTLISFTSPVILHYNSYLNYDSFLTWIGALFAIFTYLFFKAEKRKYLYYLTLTYFIGTTMKGFTTALLAVFIVQYFLIYIPHKKQINPDHYLSTISTILIGSAILYLLWPHSWVNYTDVFYQISLNLPGIDKQGVFALIIIFPYFALWLINKSKTLKSWLLTIAKPRLIYGLAFVSIGLSLINFPTRLYQTYKMYSFMHSETSYLDRIFFSLPQLFFSNNSLIVLIVLSAVIWGTFSKNKKLDFTLVSFSYFYFYVLITAILYASHVRYQFIVSSGFLLAVASFITKIAQKLNLKNSLIFTGALVLTLYSGYELVKFVPNIYLYKNQLAPTEYYPTPPSGMMGTIDALRYIKQNQEFNFSLVYSNYEGIQDRYYSYFKIVGSHGEMDLDPDSFIQFDYALFTTSGLNAMYSGNRLKAQEIYKLFEHQENLFVIQPPRYLKPQVFLKKSLPLIDINRKLTEIKNSQYESQFTAQPINLVPFSFDKNLKRNYSNNTVTLNTVGGKLIITNQEIIHECPDNINNLLESFYYHALDPEDKSRYLFINSRCNFITQSAYEEWLTRYQNESESITK